MYFPGDIVPPRLNCKSNFVKDLAEMFSLLLYNLLLEVYVHGTGFKYFDRDF